MTAPKSITVHRRSGNLVIVRRWISAEGIFVFVLALACDYGVFRHGGRDIETGSPFLSTMLFVFFAVVAMTLTYRSLGRLLNRSVIRLSDGKLSICHGPLPLLDREITVEASHVRALGIERYEDLDGDGGIISKPRLVARFEDGSQVSLLSGDLTEGDAGYLEAALREALRL